MRKNEKFRNMDKKRRKFRFGIITFLFSIIATILSILFVIQILAMGILPLHLSVPLSLIAITTCLIIFVIANFIKKRGIIHFFCGFLALVLCVVFAVGNNYIYRTNTMLESVTNLTNKMTNTVSIITMNDKLSLKKLSDNYVWLPSSTNQGFGVYLENQIIFFLYVDLLTSEITEHI